MTTHHDGLPDKISSKEIMYDLLERGCFGNTTPQWFDVDRWEQEGGPYPQWGVRTKTVGGPCRLFCPRAEVRATAEQFQRAGHKVNISIMLDTVVPIRLWADVHDDVGGLRVYGVLNPPPGGSWRKLMPELGREYAGAAAMAVLRDNLTPSSFEDLMAVRDRWPGHVYELSACRSSFGTIPGRNAVMWEVRCSDGQYERHGGWWL